MGSALYGPASGSTNTQSSQLTTDVQTLRSHIQAIRGQSVVTVAELTAFQSDLYAIAQTGFRINRQALQQVENTLVTAVANNPSAPDTSAAQTAFNNLFTGSSVSQTQQINTAFNDLLTIVQNSHITQSNLAQIAADQARIQADLGTSQSGSTTTGYAGCGGGGAGGLATATAASLLLPV